VKELEQKLQPVKASRPDVRLFPGTRKNVFQKVHAWIDDANGPNLLWLSGHPGSGKSAFAQSLAQELYQQGRLTTSFFFSQQSRVNDPKLFWRTVVYHLAISHSAIRADIMTLLNSSGASLLDDVEFQFEQIKFMLTRPKALDSFKSTSVIILDALDECNSYRSLLHTLQEWSQSSVPFKLLLTSRPEHAIKQALSDARCSVLHVALLIGKEVSAETNRDIRVVVEHRFSTICADREIAPDQWPSTNDVDKIVELAAGLFIWVTTAMNYIGDPNDDKDGPEYRLSQVTEGRMKAGDVDDLYLAILRRSFPTSHEGFQAVMGTVLLSRKPIGVSDIYRLQDYCGSESAVRAVLNALRSVLFYEKDRPVVVHHRSFADFLTSSERCQDQKFFIDSLQHSRRLTLTCLHNMNKGLRFNICNFPSSYVSNDKIKVSDQIISISYSCRFWADHLQNTDYDTEVHESIKNLLHNHLLHWLEVLSAIRDARSAIKSLEVASGWLRVSFGCNAFLPFLNLHQRVTMMSLHLSLLMPKDLFPSSSSQYLKVFRTFICQPFLFLQRHRK
jgi:hypothetical protein